MFISPALAQAATDAVATTTTVASPGGFLCTLAPLILIVGVFYIMVLRPQNKRIMEHRTLVSALQKGDKVITGGGFFATVKKFNGDDEVVLEIANGVEVTALRHTIMEKQEGKK